jgi:hypothetical protein
VFEECLSSVLTMAYRSAPKGMHPTTGNDLLNILPDIFPNLSDIRCQGLVEYFLYSSQHFFLRMMTFSSPDIIPQISLFSPLHQLHRATPGARRWQVSPLAVPGTAPGVHLSLRTLGMQPHQ